MLTGDTITDEQIREFRASLPVVSVKEFLSGGAPHSPARWHRICHAALNAANAMTERRVIADEINARTSAKDKMQSISDISSLAFAIEILKDQRDSALTDAFRESCVNAIEVAQRLMKTIAADSAKERAA